MIRIAFKKENYTAPDWINACSIDLKEPLCFDQILVPHNSHQHYPSQQAADLARKVREEEEEE
jgi:hypothetical protein